MAGRRDHERRTTHPVLPQRGLVQEPGRQEQAMHREEVVCGEAEGAVWGFGYLGRHAAAPRTVFAG
jgi:hypothetical protein